MEQRPPKDVIDPVCGMVVNPLSAPAESDFNGRTYYFCAPICRERFEEDPDQYVTRGST